MFYLKKSKYIDFDINKIFVCFIFEVLNTFLGS